MYTSRDSSGISSIQVLMTCLRSRCPKESIPIGLVNSTIAREDRIKLKSLESREVQDK